MFGGFAPAVHAAETRPNIVFIFSDDHSTQAIGAYGGRLSEFCKKQGVTPNIDRLAAQGGLFVNSFCGNSICSPSRAAVLSGLHAHANGVRGLSQGITPGTWTFPLSLGEAGYQTSVFGKWHLASNPTYETWQILPGQGTYENPTFETSKGKKNIQGYATDVITDLSLDWLAKRDKTKPFFLAVHHKAPHQSWIPPQRTAGWLDDVTIPEPSNLFDDFANRASPAGAQKRSIGDHIQLKRDLKVGPDVAKDARYAARNADYEKNKPEGDALTRWKYQQFVKDYLKCVRGVDDSVGRILEALDKAGLAENTIVIYSSDQGYFLGEHGWMDKRWIYEESLGMPFIIRWPGVVKPGSRFTELIQNIDYAPTFLEMTGSKPKEGLHGQSFVPVLRGNTPPDWRKSVYYHYYGSGGVPLHYGVRSENYTLAYYPETKEWELFDLKKDRQEMKSVAADPAYASTFAEMQQDLSRLREQYKDNEDKAPRGKKAGKGGKQERGEN